MAFQIRAVVHIRTNKAHYNMCYKRTEVVHLRLNTCLLYRAVKVKTSLTENICAWAASSHIKTHYISKGIVIHNSHGMAGSPLICSPKGT